MAVSSQVSVVIPLTDARGDATEHLSTWTHGQTQPRTDYEVVIVSDGSEPDVDRDVAALLQPHDRFEVAEGASMIELWNRAADLASSEWLLFTENHVQAESDCVEKVIEGIRSDPALEAASIDHGHLAHAPIGELGARWFDDVYAEWFRPDQWHRLNLAGFVIRSELHRSVGGHDHRYGLFAAPLLSAQLSDRGANVGHLPDARILHIQCDEVDEHHEHSADYVVGESEARTSLQVGFAERYFGYRPLVWNRRALGQRAARRAIALLLRQALRRASRRRSDFRWLSREFASRLPEALAGIRLRRRIAELAFSWSELVANSRWVPAEGRYRAYLRAQDRITRLAQLRWIENRDEDGPAGLEPGEHPIESIGEGTLVGVSGLESHDGRNFRWSEPVLTIRCVSSSGGTLRIDTGGLRGRPLGCVAAAYEGSRRLPGGELREEGSDLVFSLPGGTVELTLLCRPLPVGADEPRRLGLPLFALEFGDRSSRPEPAATPERATVA